MKEVSQGTPVFKFFTEFTQWGHFSYILIVKLQEVKNVHIGTYIIHIMFYGNYTYYNPKSP